jgi:hypothetical protein
MAAKRDDERPLALPSRTARAAFARVPANARRWSSLLNSEKEPHWSAHSEREPCCSNVVMAAPRSARLGLPRLLTLGLPSTGSKRAPSRCSARSNEARAARCLPRSTFATARSSENAQLLVE